MKIAANASRELRERLVDFRSILLKMRADNAKEAEVSRIIARILTEALGYSGYGDLEQEYSIGDDRCDYALWSKGAKRGRPTIVIECKAVGISLGERQRRQLRDYAFRKEIKWAILSNGLEWEVYEANVRAKESDKWRTIFTIDLTSAKEISDETVGLFYAISKEGVNLGHLEALSRRVRFFVPERIAALIVEEKPVKFLVKMMKELHNVDISFDEMRAMLKDSVIGKAVECAEVPKKNTRSLTKPMPKKPIDATEAQNIEFTLTGRGVVAKGRKCEHGFLVQAGVKICDPVPSFAKSAMLNVRKRLEGDGKIVDRVLVVDHAFASPSAAAAVILGRTSNGRREWKTSDGRTYGEMFSR